jgi:hypothetical protein
MWVQQGKGAINQTGVVIWAGDFVQTKLVYQLSAQGFVVGAHNSAGVVGMVMEGAPGVVFSQALRLACLFECKSECDYRSTSHRVKIDANEQESLRCQDTPSQR